MDKGPSQWSPSSANGGSKAKHIEAQLVELKISFYSTFLWVNRDLHSKYILLYLQCNCEVGRLNEGNAPYPWLPRRPVGDFKRWKPETTEACWNSPPLAEASSVSAVAPVVSLSIEGQSQQHCGAGWRMTDGQGSIGRVRATGGWSHKSNIWGSWMDR